MKKILVNVLKAVLFFGVGFTILYLVFQDNNAAYQEQCLQDGIPAGECSLIGKIIEDFRGANYFWLFMVLVAFTISNISRAVRWLMLIRPLGYQARLLNAFFTIMLGYFANLGLPRAGEIVRAASFSRVERIPLEKVMGTWVIDRGVDVLAFLLVTGLAFALEFDRLVAFVKSFSTENGNGTSFTWLWVLAGIGLLLLALMWYFRKQLLEIPFVRKIWETMLGFWEGILAVRKLERPFWFVFHSVNIWFMYYLMTYLGFLAFGPTAGLGALAALVVYVVGSLGIIIPSPGGMGTYHFLVTAVLVSFYGLANGDAFSFANLLFFSIQLGCNVLLGLVAIGVLAPQMLRVKEEDKQKSEATN